MVNRPPVIRLVNDILFRALQMRASDIHVHPYEAKIQIRYRVDGILYDMLSLNRNVLPLIISRIKVMAGMDIAERRMPQDGRSSVRLGQREVDLRVSTVPTSFGERCVLRILDKSSGVYGLDELGLWPDDLKKLDSLLNRAHGVIFVTGPTGSGKSTSLYAYLNRINSAEKNVITIEDPIEYQLDGISQIQVASKKGMTFATSLRHVLRQDPDVIMVGEVRDVGDGPHGDPVVADRPPGVQHAAHQRRGRRDQPVAGPRRRAVPGQFLADRHRGPAARAEDLPGLPQAVAARRPSSSASSAWDRSKTTQGPTSTSAKAATGASRRAIAAGPGSMK